MLELTAQSCALVIFVEAALAFQIILQYTDLCTRLSPILVKMKSPEGSSATEPELSVQSIEFSNCSGNIYTV